MERGYMSDSLAKILFYLGVSEFHRWAKKRGDFGTMVAFQEQKQFIKDMFWVLKGLNRVSQTTLEG